MLVLTRRVAETISITGPATITLLELRNGGARIGIDAPASTVILRGELIEDYSDKPKGTEP